MVEKKSSSLRRIARRQDNRQNKMSKYDENGSRYSCQTKVRRHSGSSTELDRRIVESWKNIRRLEIMLKLTYVSFQINMSQERDNENSISLLESGMMEGTQEGKLECQFCPAKYVRPKSLQNHLKAKHNIGNSEEEDKDKSTFSPLKSSTMDNDEESGIEPEKEKGEVRANKRKAENHKAEEALEETEEQVDEQIKQQMMDREKRRKHLERLEERFDEEVDDSTMIEAGIQAEQGTQDGGNNVNTQALTEDINKQIEEAESKIIVMENDLNDTFGEDKDGVIENLKKQLELKDMIISGKDTKLIEQEGRICELGGLVDKQARIINKKSMLIKDKDKEIKSIMRSTNNITIKAGLSPSKEELKKNLLQKKRQVENLNGRIKNLQEAKEKAERERMGATEGEKNQYEKMQAVVEHTVQELDGHKQKIAYYESEIRKLKKRIPCENKECTKTGKECAFSHSLEYKRYIPPQTYKKNLLCDNFAGKGCNKSDEECTYSHSLELLAKKEAGDKGVLNGRDFTKDSFGDEDNSFGLLDHRFKKVSQPAAANYDSSIEVVADYSISDPRRTVNLKDGKESNALNNNESRSNKYSGNAKGSLENRSHPRAQEYYVNQRPRREERRDGAMGLRDYAREKVRSRERGTSSWEREERRNFYSQDPRDLRSNLSREERRRRDENREREEDRRRSRRY